MVSAITGGPGPVAVSPVAKSHELDQGREQARQASVAAAQGAAAQADPATIQRSAIYGVASNLNSQKAENEDTKRKLARRDRGEDDEDPPVRDDGEPRHTIDVEA